MTKKIKSFTADEDIYNRLVMMFKKYEAETSISMYLNNQITYLLEKLEDFEKGLKEMNYSIPMKFIIDETVRQSEKSGRISNEIYEDECPISDLERDLIDWQDDYNAYKEGVPSEYYSFLRSGDFVLTKDKKFLIDKKTGKKYVSRGKNHLMEVREIDSEDKN